MRRATRPGGGRRTRGTGPRPRRSRPRSGRCRWRGRGTGPGAASRGWCRGAPGGPGGLDEMIISLYAGGMTVRDIQHHLARTIGTELSHDTISKITDAVAEEVKAWQGRPLEELYPVIYLDALVVKVRDGHQVRNKAAHIAVGIDLDGSKHVLGIWVRATECSNFSRWVR